VAADVPCSHFLQELHAHRREQHRGQDSEDDTPPVMAQLGAEDCACQQWRCD
jgi:hypothetical protein